jgi:Rps23 Pro-64 3,4-dihydroxylase Tpa1-like proline 4-hydroxylase
MTDFLAPAEHRRLLDHVLAHQDEFRESGIVGPQGELGVLDYAVRKSRTLSGARLEEIWDMFERRLGGILPAVRRELGIPWFSVGKVERQLTVHGSGGFFVPHVDTGSAIVASRRISCVYYFHATPQRFTGGELKLYDTWVTPSGTTGAATHTTLAPVDNSIVFFPSDAFHEVCPVHPDSDAFGDSRFTITVWFHEGQRPARLDGVEAP